MSTWKSRAISGREIRKSTKLLRRLVEEQDTHLSSYCSIPTSLYEKVPGSPWHNGVTDTESNGILSQISELPQRIKLKFTTEYDHACLAYQFRLSILDTYSDKVWYYGRIVEEVNLDEPDFRRFLFNDMVYAIKKIVTEEILNVED